MHGINYDYLYTLRRIFLYLHKNYNMCFKLQLYVTYFYRAKMKENRSYEKLHNLQTYLQESCAVR